MAHWAKRRVQAVKLIAKSTGACGQAGIAVEPAVNASIICKVEKGSPTPDQKINRVLVGMDARDIAASVHMSQVHERVGSDPIAGRKDNGHRALVEVGSACVKISRRSVGNGRESQVVTALRGPAAPEKVTAIRNSGIIDSRPGCASIQALPNTLVRIVRVDIPGVHLIACGLICRRRNNRNLAAVDRTTARQHGLGWTHGGVEARSRLVGKPYPIDSVRR